MDNVHNRLRDVRDKIELACRRSGRNPVEITLVGASKTVRAGLLLRYVHEGLRELGENYVQEGLAKQQELKQQEIKRLEPARVQARYDAGEIDKARTA